MPRIRFVDFRLSDGPLLCGLSQQDGSRCANLANRAQSRLLSCPEQADEGWWGTWAEMAFQVSQTAPYLTTPREVARLEAITLCNRWIPLQNQFYEYLSWNNGRLPKTFQSRGCQFFQQAYTRNNVPTFVDLNPAPQIIAIFPSSTADIGLQVLIQGQDASGTTVYSLDQNNAQALGQYVTLGFPFVVTPMPFSTITGIQKPPTSGPIQFFQMDPVSGAQVLLLTMEPSEQSASYRRYYFANLPSQCCVTTPGTTAQPLTVTALAALEAIPVAADSDYFLIQNLEAIIAEAQSVYYAAKEDAQSKGIAQERHKEAVRLLIGELTRYQGKNDPAVSFRPFGSARLERQSVGMI
jgi:hypothetical protein